MALHICRAKRDKSLLVKNIELPVERMDVNTFRLAVNPMW